MQIKQRTVDQIVILDISGKIQLGADEIQLSREVSELLEQGHQRLILNLEQVSYVDSSGLGEIVRCYAATRRAGGELKLANLTQRLVDLLTITKLTNIFDPRMTEEEALHAFGSSIPE